MTPAAAVAASTSLVVLATSAIRSLVLATVVALALAAFRVRSSSLRLFTWTAVLYAALAMPFLGAMLPMLSIPVPTQLRFASFRLQDESARLSSSQAERPSSQINSSTPVANRQSPSRIKASSVPEDFPAGTSPLSSSIQDERAQSASTTLTHAESQVSASATDSVPWTLVATAIYLAVACVFLARIVVGFVFSRRLLRASIPIADSRMSGKLAVYARRARIDSIPSARESELISVPLTMGVWRSAILLPVSWREWDDANLDAVLMHEISHAARRDALTQRLSLMHRALFWFSPLAWWLDRQLANLAEQASDEAALLGGADCDHYARTLLGFFETLHAAPARVWWQGVSMAKAGQAEKRVERILSWKGSNAMNLNRRMAVFVIAVAIPAVYFTAAVQANFNGAAPQHIPYVATDQDQTPPPPQAATTAPRAPSSAMPPSPAAVAPGDAPSAESEPLSQADTAIAPAAPATAAPAAAVNGVVVGVPSAAVGVIGSGPAVAVSPRAVIAPVAPLPPAIGYAQKVYGVDSGKGFYYLYSDDDNDRFVIVTGKTDSLTMSGSSEDARHAEKLRKEIAGDFIWFERDGKSYIIRDQAIIDRAKKLWEPQDELGKKQEALGKQQEALGAQQEALGKQMEEVHVKLPDMTADLERLKAEMKNLSSGATIDQVGELQSEIGELQSRIGEIQSQAGSEQSKIGAQMGALGAKQGELGRQQGELGRQQGELAREAEREMHKIFDEAIASGKAQPEI